MPVDGPLKKQSSVKTQRYVCNQRHAGFTGSICQPVTEFTYNWKHRRPHPPTEGQVGDGHRFCRATVFTATRPGRGRVQASDQSRWADARKALTDYQGRLGGGNTDRWRAPMIGPRNIGPPSPPPAGFMTEGGGVFGSETHPPKENLDQKFG